NLTLNGLTQDADLRLYRRNANGSLTSIASSTRGGTATDSITRNLGTGNYVARVYRHGTANTNYNLQLEADQAGPPGPHRNIGTLHGRRNFQDFVGSTDRNDDYRFSLSEPNRVNLTLNGLTQDADLRLYRRNANGSLTSIASSTRGGTATDSITRNLGTGNYVARVNRFGGANTNYNLRLEADQAGNSRFVARNIGQLSGTRNFQDFVGSTDTNDYYRFNLPWFRNRLDITLNGLGADADLHLLNSSGTVIASSTRGGTNADTITRTLNPGTYYARVNRFGGANTNYNLRLRNSLSLFPFPAI
ncbi:PPC domain-containing protein, partial [Dapis sp. BLCC M172]|uniref:PPC domain-containing protein n=1 Tax=Dapis sp. BLCC M172 TaxID=2975281 RepID=UPI003CFB9004